MAIALAHHEIIPPLWLIRSRIRRQVMRAYWSNYFPRRLLRALSDELRIRTWPLQRFLQHRDEVFARNICLDRGLDPDEIVPVGPRVLWSGETPCDGAELPLWYLFSTYQSRRHRIPLFSTTTD